MFDLILCYVLCYTPYWVFILWVCTLCVGCVIFCSLGKSERLNQLLWIEFNLSHWSFRSEIVCKMMMQIAANAIPQMLTMLNNRVIHWSCSCDWLWQMKCFDWERLFQISSSSWTSSCASIACWIDNVDTHTISISLTRLKSFKCRVIQASIWHWRLSD